MEHNKADCLFLCEVRHRAQKSHNCCRKCGHKVEEEGDKNSDFHGKATYFFKPKFAHFLRSCFSFKG